MKKIDGNRAGDISHQPGFLSAQSWKMPQPKALPAGDELVDDLPLPVLLWRARLAVSSCYRANLREFGLTEQQWRVLRRLSRVPCEDISDMAAQTDILPSSLSRILRDLANRKLLARSSRESTDKRRSFASLTAAGRRLVDDVDADLMPIGHELERFIGAKKLGELNRILGDLIAWIETRKASPASLSSWTGQPLRSERRPVRVARRPR
jgi:homoprotocatechuate degradation regulator HpaR